MHKKLCYFLSTFFLLLLVLLGLRYLPRLNQFNYMKFPDPKSLIAASDLIIAGQVTGRSEAKLNINLDPSADPLYIKYTLVDVRLTDTFLGNKQVGETIQIKYPTKDDLGYAKTLDQSLRTDNQVILFLNDFNTPECAMPYSLVNPEQGILLLRSSKSPIPPSPYSLFDTANHSDLICLLHELCQ